MTNEGGPWGRAEDAGSRVPAPAPRPPVGRLGLWAIVLAALILLVVALAKAFPEAVRTTEDWSNVAYLMGFLVLLSAGVFRFRRAAITQHLKHVAAWAVIVAALALGYAYREDLAGVPRHLQLAFATGNPVTTGDHELMIPQDDRGAFVVIGKVNGQRVRFMIDTGATDTVLSPDDARRLGVDVDGLHYGSVAETANGLGYGAPFTVNRLEVGPIGFDDFKTTINKAPMSTSLLGMSFLGRLTSFELRGRNLILKWRG